MSETLQKEFTYYLVHQDELVEKYDGKFVVIKDETVLDAFDNELQAVTETMKAEKVGTFLVQFVSPGDSAYSQTFHSGVVFS